MGQAITTQGVYEYDNVPFNTEVVLASYQLQGSNNAYFTGAGTKVWSPTDATNFTVRVLVNGVERDGGVSNGAATVNTQGPTDQIANNGTYQILVKHQHSGMLHNFKGLIFGTGSTGS